MFPSHDLGGDTDPYTALNPLTFPTVQFDSHNGYNNSTYRYTVPESGKYAVFCSAGSTNSNGNQLYLYKNGTGIRTIGHFFGNSATGCAVVDLEKDDIIDVRAQGSSSGSSGPGSGNNWAWGAHKVGGAQDSEASGRVVAAYLRQAGNDTFSGTGNIIQLNTTTYDTHGGHDTGAYTYTIPESGYYSITRGS